MRLIVILNPVAGQHEAERIWSQSALPLITDFAAAHPVLALKWAVYSTSSPGDASTLVAEAMKDQDASQETVYLVVLGGDGTTHEALNGLIRHDPTNYDAQSTPPTTDIALVPAGTANALYAQLFQQPTDQAKQVGLQGEHAWRLLSIHALLNGLLSNQKSTMTPTRLPLTLIRHHLTGVDGNDNGKEEVLIAHVVSSHALHASILVDSDSPELRQKYPGIERFKVAAGLNVNRWVNGPSKSVAPETSTGQVHLRPYIINDREILKRYEPRSRTWVDILTDAETTLTGPFFYFVAVQTDRLEPTFVPAPFSAPYATPTPAQQEDDWSQLSSTLSRPAEAVDVVIIRPTRDPQVQALSRACKSETEAVSWFASNRVGPVTAAMYDRGQHVHLTYPANTTPEAGLERDGPGDYVVEYFRTGGYLWSPGATVSEPRSRAACIDGTIRFADQVSARAVSSWAGKVGVWV